ncbi:hypothetical protein [uncultured Methylobacterium sp.]|uniref:hypothetical protein n=1 Tax=uncultured Methylobacterium sp. TaxID=157278 RepID=UPI0035CBB9CF
MAARPKLTGMVTHAPPPPPKFRPRRCAICAASAPFGFRDFLGKPELAVFACREHRDQVAAAVA